MPRKKSRKKRKRKTVGLGGIVEPGVGALYVRGAWMKKLKEMGKHKRKLMKKSRSKRK
ncbi:MAG: hypothetical protein NWE85_05870 [Candidatus Bathyarchaeota archaeon]|nr:hypothetical protein [Candidatus Bathyarchaeota archaeon]